MFSRSKFHGKWPDYFLNDFLLLYLWEAEVGNEHKWAQMGANASPKGHEELKSLREPKRKMERNLVPAEIDA